MASDERDTDPVAGSLYRVGDRWAERAPSRCTNGHPLVAGSVLVGSRACSCDRGHHRTHQCERCGVVLFTPELRNSCSDASFDSRAARTQSPVVDNRRHEQQ
ncbi:hypothetical protein CH256_14350 [Rhodococcus sp. 05-2254-6]|nr:hypothetical protein A2J02_00710 [Rhodococcus sp. EPR-147]KZF08390.1 hypothetical protein A2J04_01230 [Rhodococcus sp. EPR-279]OZE30500.1 hypothetical protein CH256_14350 [Rhodococcus sp. 05-2254-6]